MRNLALIAGAEVAARELSPHEARLLHDRLDRAGVDSSVYRPEPSAPFGWLELFGTLPIAATEERAALLQQGRHHAEA
jgi:hypothetical protein